MSTRILLVDDHLMFGDAVQFMLQTLDPGITVHPVGSVADALTMLGRDDDFQLLLLDFSMPDVGGLDGITTIQHHYPHIAVAFLSGVTDPYCITQALDLGAQGWIPKSMSGEPLLYALRLMCAGERFVPADLLIGSPRASLTSREADVAELLAQGLSDKQIAGRLSLQLGTVKVHVKSVLKKFGAENRTRFALSYRGLKQ